jgi:hypothetical protein
MCRRRPKTTAREVSAVGRAWAARKRQRDQLDILVGGFTPRTRQQDDREDRAHRA